MWRPTRRQAWLLRAALLFFGVYLLGLTGVPTLVPYLAVVMAVLADGARVLAGSRRRPRP